MPLKVFVIFRYWIQSVALWCCYVSLRVQLKTMHVKLHSMVDIGKRKLCTYIIVTTFLNYSSNKTIFHYNIQVSMNVLNEVKLLFLVLGDSHFQNYELIISSSYRRKLSISLHSNAHPSLYDSLNQLTFLLQWAN